jgi:hypothetical protein
MSRKKSFDKGPTSFDLNRELMKELGHACVDDEITKTQAIEEGVRLWLDKRKEDAAGLPQKRRAG